MLHVLTKQPMNDVETNSSNLDVSLGEYLSSYSDVFKERYLIPMGAAIWSTPSEKMNDFPARTFVKFFKNHGLLGVTTQHQWLTVSGGSKNYVEKIEAEVSGKIILNSDVLRIKRHAEGVTLIHKDGSQSNYDKVVMAMHAPQALEMLEDASLQEERDTFCLCLQRKRSTLAQ